MADIILECEECKGKEAKEAGADITGETDFGDSTQLITELYNITTDPLLALKNKKYLSRSWVGWPGEPLGGPAGTSILLMDDAQRIRSCSFCLYILFQFQQNHLHYFQTYL